MLDLGFGGVTSHMIHVLLTSVQRRRSDLAVLKALGLRPSQVLGTVLWQASALAAAGLPLGVLADRWAWVLVAQSAGTAIVADIALVLAAIPVTLLVAIVIAAGPRLGRRPDQPGHRPAHRVNGAGWRRGCIRPSCWPMSLQVTNW